MVDGDCAGQISELVSCVLCPEGKDQGNSRRMWRAEGTALWGIQSGPPCPHSVWTVNSSSGHLRMPGLGKKISWYQGGWEDGLG